MLKKHITLRRSDTRNHHFWLFRKKNMFNVAHPLSEKKYCNKHTFRLEPVGGQTWGLPFVDRRRNVRVLWGYFRNTLKTGDMTKSFCMSFEINKRFKSTQFKK